MPSDASSMRKELVKRMSSQDLALCRGRYLPKEQQYQCKMPVVNALPPGAFEDQIAQTLPLARGLFRRTIPSSPYSGKLTGPSAASRWCDREDEAGWPGHHFKHRVNALGQVTPSSSMCTPVHERTRPVFYHPITKAPPQLEYTSKDPSKDLKKQRFLRRPHTAGPKHRGPRPEHSLSGAELEAYEQFVELLAGMDKAEVADMLAGVIKDAEEKNMLRAFSGASS